MKILVQYSIDPKDQKECGKCPQLVYSRSDQQIPSTCRLFGEMSVEQGWAERCEACRTAEQQYARLILEPMREVHVLLKDEAAVIGVEDSNGIAAKVEWGKSLSGCLALGPFRVPWDEESRKVAEEAIKVGQQL